MLHKLGQGSVPFKADSSPVPRESPDDNPHDQGYKRSSLQSGIPLTPNKLTQSRIFSSSSQRSAHMAGSWALGFISR